MQLRHSFLAAVVAAVVVASAAGFTGCSVSQDAARDCLPTLTFQGATYESAGTRSPVYASTPSSLGTGQLLDCNDTDSDRNFVGSDEVEVAALIGSTTEVRDAVLVKVAAGEWVLFVTPDLPSSEVDDLIVEVRTVGAGSA